MDDVRPWPTGVPLPDDSDGMWVGGWEADPDRRAGWAHVLSPDRQHHGVMRIEEGEDAATAVRYLFHSMVAQFGDCDP